ncbi:sensor histidine kinase [Metabacillus sediminilitoris]|uniref:histidine kinase n=1 Tax=Metabacillus sediminilitoris TaxID=2567941 RepID=A0A4S4C5S5_9BACI|nr:HAMP domain-containing sensor histidine kinase [Metabacillus sediminilitoris]QGQ47825.1 GHKL domain-containing protein [Metabacillus sediminilitoris]THF81062.1 GHKL domain-containing protein [Metabacillus sediminilitoris]
MELVKELILQISFIIIPIFIYQFIWLSKSHSYILKPNKVIITCSTILSSLFCIIWPIEFIDGLFFNLQAIPLFVSFIYGGLIPGLLTLLTTIVFRIYFFDIEWYYVAVSLIIYSVIPFFIYRKWKDFGLKKKYLFSIIYGCSNFAVTLLYYSVVSVSFSSRFTLDHLLAMSINMASLTIILICSIYLIEYMTESTRIRMELVNAEKMSIVSELAASVAHEVRNPLTVVRGFIQLIGSTSDITITKKREYMDIVLNELDRAEAIISDYLGLASQQFFLKEKIDLYDILEEVTMLMTSYANFKTVSIQSHIDHHLFVIGDKAKLKQVFINIIKNAIEAVSNVDGNVIIKAFTSHEVVRIKVIDNGIGMSPEQITRLGEPYYTLKENGTGLGLTVTYTIIKNHGGSIRYKSEPNKGTVAIISLPIYKEEK